MPSLRGGHLVFAVALPSIPRQGVVDRVQGWTTRGSSQLHGLCREIAEGIVYAGRQNGEGLVVGEAGEALTSKTGRKSRRATRSSQCRIEAGQTWMSSRGVVQLGVDPGGNAGGGRIFVCRL